MKSYYFAAVRSWLLSLPSRERGLKYSGTCYTDGGNTVAPLAGAWIEIDLIEEKTPLLTVAPLAGAWIEINTAAQLRHLHLPSLPSRERGLKYRSGVKEGNINGSLPSRERGLKFFLSPFPTAYPASLPSRERGLKYQLNLSPQRLDRSLPSRERGLKSTGSLPLSGSLCRSPRGSVD